MFAVLPDESQLALLKDPNAAAPIRRGVEALSRAGVPVLDGMDANSLSFEPGEGPAHNGARLDGLQPGVNYLICHPARGGEELDSIAPEAHARDFERAFYGGDAGRSALESRGIRTIGMRAIRDLMRE